METQMLGKLFGKKVFPLTWKMHTVLCVFYCKHLIWMGKCASCQMPKRIGAKRSLSLSLSLCLCLFPLKGFKGIPHFHLLFAIYLIRHWPALGSFLLGRARVSTLLS